jgi:hypothetical protein
VLAHVHVPVPVSLKYVACHIRRVSRHKNTLLLACCYDTSHHSSALVAGCRFHGILSAFRFDSRTICEIDLELRFVIIKKIIQRISLTDFLSRNVREARTRCQDWGGDLASIKDAQDFKVS